MLEQLDTFVGPDVQWFALSPMLALLGGALALLLLGALTPLWPRGLYAAFTAAIAVAVGVLAMFQWDDISDDGPSTLVGGAIAFDTLAMFVTITIAIGLLLVALLSDDYLRGTPNDGPEIYALYMTSALGAIVAASANDLIVLYLGLETMSLALYVLAASGRSRGRSSEAGIKYFVLGGFASAFFLYGIALIYGATGTTNITEMVTAMQTSGDVFNPDSLALAGIGLLIVGLAFKVAAAPFHVWVPDVYQGAPTPITAFMASVGKAAAFVALLRVLVIALPFYRDDWRPIIWVLALLSLLVGSSLAIVQNNVKRMLAYSSVSHAGFILVGVEAAAHRAGEADAGSGMPAVVMYLMLYSVLVIGSFGVVAVVQRESGGDASLDAFKGLVRRRPTLAIAMTVFLLAQAGVPLTSGFIAKFGVIQAAVEEQSYAIAIIAMVAAVIAAFLYLKIMVSMWLVDPADGSESVPVPVPFGAGLAITAAVAFTLVVGVFPGWLIEASNTVTTFAR